MAGSTSQGMNNLTTLIKRLEAATSRLEDIAASSIDANAVAGERGAQQDGPSQSLPVAGHHDGRPEATEAGANGVVSKAATGPPLPPSIAEMDEILEHEGKEYYEASRELDPLIQEQAASVTKAGAEQRRFLLVATRAKKPDMSTPAFSEMIKDLQQHMSTVGDVRDNNRASPMKDHLAMVGEGITALQWLVMEGKPAEFVGEVIGGAQMYGNRVLKTYKETDQKHVKYVQAYYAFLKALQTYIKKHYPSGVSWNNSGVDIEQASREAENEAQVHNVSSAAPPPSGGAPPPPPPPPPLPTFDNSAPPPPPAPGASQSQQGGQDSMGAVFEQLNRGEAVTSGLKKVDQSQMTHKNPSLRASSDRNGSDESLSRSRSRGPEPKPKPSSMRQNSTQQPAAKKPAGKTELDGNKWIIENWDSPQKPIEIDVEIQHSVLISKCNKTTIVLKGKGNAISIDNSPRAQILVDTLVSSVDVIKSPNFALQVTGSLPTIMLDQVDGASLYFGAQSLATEVFTSKCSSVNIVLPPAKEEDDSKELPLPEQMRTYIKNGKLVTEIVEHAG